MRRNDDDGCFGCGAILFAGTIGVSWLTGLGVPGEIAILIIVVAFCGIWLWVIVGKERERRLQEEKRRQYENARKVREDAEKERENEARDHLENAEEKVSGTSRAGVSADVPVSPTANSEDNVEVGKDLIALECLRCGKEIQIEKQSDDAVVRCPFCHYRNAFRANRPSRFEPVFWFPLADDADRIRKFANERGITRVVHFTSFKNLVGIFKSGKLLSRLKLAMSGGEWFHANDLNRWDGRLNYINTSIERINVSLFRAMEKRGWESGHDLGFWCILEFDPVCLEKRNVLFSVDNAASTFVRRCGTHMGINGLSAMFAETVTTGRQVEGQTQVYSIQRSYALPLNWTTADQAEVLIPEELPIQLLNGIVFQSEYEKGKAIDGLNAHGVVVPKDVQFRVDRRMFESKMAHRY